MNAFLAVNAKYFRTSKKCKPISHGNRHEWVCGPTTSERSDWRRSAYPEMAVYEGGVQSQALNKATQKQTQGGVQHKTHPTNRASRRAAHTVAPKITNAPNTVVTIGTSENKNQPHSDAHNKSKNRSDCKADTSTAWKARVMK
jgi:hypothetical protein